MKTPFQHFIQLAQRVMDATNVTQGNFNPSKGIEWINEAVIVFGDYPITCKVQIVEGEGYAQSLVQFDCPIDYDCNGFDELFIEWTKNVDEFLASDSMLLLDNQIKAGLRK